MQVHILCVLLICRQFNQLARIFDGAVGGDGTLTIGDIGFSLVLEYNGRAAHRLAILIYYGDVAIFVFMQVHVFNGLFVVGQLDQLAGIIDSAIWCDGRFVAGICNIGLALVFIHHRWAVHRIAILIYYGDVAILIFV